MDEWTSEDERAFREWERQQFEWDVEAHKKLWV